MRMPMRMVLRERGRAYLSRSMPLPNHFWSLIKPIFSHAPPILTRALQRLFHFFSVSISFIMESKAPFPLAPPPFDPKKPAVPISFPISKLEDLETRSYFDSFHFPFNRASVPLPRASSPAQPLRPRLLVCHDMAGGYVDDKWIQGGTNSDAYAIWHWHLIDIFVYFSHNLVTLPPPCWTNAAHTHGVKVLGTFIMEWDEGRLVCNSLLLTKESARIYAERLTELAVALGFDGWLINMEIELDLEQISNLKEFLSHLTQTMHSSVPGSLVIWYDSVTKDGRLLWQNRLNENNKPFFDLCDGIFVNYTWKADYPKISAAIAGERKFDVYMGIDVFGRNTYGGGQWNTNVALEVLKNDAVSAAIFAPGWVYETKQGPDFQTAQNRWWGLVEKSWGIHQNYPKLLPFYSNFDQGHGNHVFIEGQQVSDNPWCNISCQSFQPILEDASDMIKNKTQLFRNFEDPAYSGGLNITFKGTLDDNDCFSTRLFRGDLPLSNLPLHISYSVRSNGSSLLGLVLEFSSSMNGRTIIFLRPNGTNLAQLSHPVDLSVNNFNKVVQLQVRNVEAEGDGSTGWILHECSLEMDGYTLTDIRAICYRLREIGNKGFTEKQAPKLEDGSYVVPTGPIDCHVSLGHFSIRTSAENMVFPPSSTWSVESKNITWALGSNGSKTLSVKLVWGLKQGSYSMFLKYNIYIKRLAGGAGGSEVVGEEEYVGVARVEAFYVSELLVPAGVSKLKFFIQVCGVDGACQKLDDSPALLLSVEG